MSWLASVVVGLLTGIVGLLASGFLASRAVEWYGISSFEGGSGYFVVGLALLGFLAGGIIGVVTARTMAPGDPGMLRVLGTASFIVVAVAGAIGGLSRLLADVAPTLDGEPLLLAFEVRWPTPPAIGADSLGARATARLATDPSLRNGRDGMLFVEDAQARPDGWVVPGVVELFTAGSDRRLVAGVGDSALVAFDLPLAARPRAADREWSTWLAGPAAPGGGGAVALRYRVVPVSQAVREQRVGPFVVTTIVSAMHAVSGARALAASSTFRVTLGGAPIAGLDTVGAVAAVGTDGSALLVKTGDPTGTTPCYLVTAGPSAPELTSIGDCGPYLRGALLTADDSAWHAARRARPTTGWLDLGSFRLPGLYRIDGGILDTRTRRFTSLEGLEEGATINGLVPIALAPDEASYATFTHDGDPSRPALAVTNWRERTGYLVPIDRPRMRYNAYEALDPAWVQHHFTWTGGAGGAMRLVPRTDFTPLPYRGEREIDAQGRITSYYLRPGGIALRNAIMDAMVTELGGERMPDELDGYHRVVRLDGRLVKGAVVGSAGFISIGTDFGSEDPALMARLADQLDRLVASGRFDSLFVVDPPAAPGQ